VTGSNHYGIAGFYALQAMEVGLLVRLMQDSLYQLGTFAFLNSPAIDLL